MAETRNETFNEKGEVVTTETVDRATLPPNMVAIVAARNALKAIVTRPNANADIKAVAQFLLYLTYQFEGAATNV